MPDALVKIPAAPTPERNLSWGEVDWIIETSVSKMRNELHYIPKRIIPIGGGGIIPAALMAYRFYKKDHAPVLLLPPVYAKSYAHDHSQHRLSLYWPEHIDEYNKRDTLFVDDILDTGATWEAVMSRMPKCAFYAMVTKIAGQPYIWGERDKTNQWWNFPWEKSGIIVEKKG